MGEVILLIDDDAMLVRVLSQSLERSGFKVIVASDGYEGLRLAYEHRPDLVILDVMMPRLDGWTVCRRLREMSDMPILLLTAKATEDDVIHGLDLGADDYVTKPFSLLELKARIRALLRRVSETPDRWRMLYDDGELSVDLARQQVLRRGEPVDLTPTEFRLLACLVRRAGRVVSHADLLTEVWGEAYRDEVRYLSVYVRYLRQKIEDDPSNPRYIQTKWGVGYCFVGRGAQCPAMVPDGMRER